MRTHLYKQYKPETLKKLHEVELEILEAVAEVCEKHNLCYFAAWGTAIGVERHQGFIPWDDDVDLAMPRKDYDKFMQVWKEEFKGKYEVVTPLTEPSYCCTVTHVQKVGTKFVLSLYKGKAPYENGICIDIFPLDNLADNPKLQKQQLKRSWFWGRLLFLVGTPHPVIPVKTPVIRQGMIGACFIAHYILKLFRVSPAKIYLKLEKEKTRFKNSDTEYVTAFDDPAASKARIKRSEINKMVWKKFETIMLPVPERDDAILTRYYGDYMQLPPEEQRVNHAPEILEFGDE